MKRHIESRGAIQYVQRVLAVADRIDYAVRFDPSKVRTELKAARVSVRAATRRWVDSSYMPCGYQDAAGEALMDARETFNALLDAIRVCRGVWPKRLDDALERGVA